MMKITTLMIGLFHWNGLDASDLMGGFEMNKGVSSQFLNEFDNRFECS